MTRCLWLLLLLLVGCGDKPCPVDVPSQSAAAKVQSPTIKHQGKMHWVPKSGFMKSYDSLICDSSGMILASVSLDGEHEVFGGNGAAYGEFLNNAQARKHAEYLVANPPSLGSDSFQCEP